MTIKAQEDPNVCPKCGGYCYRESVDIGVGVIHGPYGCINCGWSEDSYYDSSDGTCQAELENPKYHYDSRGGAILKTPYSYD
jgi:hypothetical protein